MLVREVPLRMQLVIFACFASIAAALSVTAFHHQLHALTIGGRDLGFFMAEYERLLDVPVWRGLAAQPSGNDAFGFAGLDAQPTLHYDIHFSPLKYVLAGIRRLTSSWRAVQLALVSTVLLGLGYALSRFQKIAPGNTLALVALGALGVSPLFVIGTCNDLRPAGALAGIAVALAVALLTRAPTRHLVVIAILGLLVREESAVLLSLAAAWLVLEGRRADAWRLFGIAAVFVAAFHVLYLGLLHFTYAPHAQIAAVWLALLLPSVLLLAPDVRIAALVAAHARHRSLTIAILAAPFVAILADPFFRAHLVRSAFVRAFPALLVVVVAAIDWMLTSVSPIARRRATYALAFAMVPGLALSIAYVQGLAVQAARNDDVWALAGALPPGTPILTDFEHYQAFTGRDGLLV